MRRIAFAIAVSITGCGPPPAEQAQAESPPVTFDGARVSEASAKVAHGRRLADVLGCAGCHGSDLTGQRFYELYASNLTRDVPNYTDQQLERLLREGVHPTGRDVWGMPSEIFQHLSAPDMAALIAYLRTPEPAGEPTQPPLPFPPEVRELIAKGAIKPAADAVRDSKPRTPLDLGSTYALGRYIAMVTCAECHGPDLKGNERGAPDLVVAGAYTREDFDKLMTQGISTPPRKLPMMAGVARGRFSKMTRQERDALYAYLKARAEQPQ